MAMNETEHKLAKQYLLRVRREGYTLVENTPTRSGSEINVDIYRGESKIARFDDGQLGEWCLQVRTDDSTRPDIKDDYYKLFYMFIGLRDLYVVYERAAPLQGYDDSLGYRSVMEHNGCTLAVNARNIHGELEFGTFRTGVKSRSYGDFKIITDNIYYDMDDYAAARLNFVERSSLLPKEQLITPESIKYLRGSCNKTMARDGHLFDEDTKTALSTVISDLDKVQASFDDAKHRTSAIPAKDAQYIEVNILDVKGIYTSKAIDRETVPKGLHAYDIQYSRDKMEPDTLWTNVIGRHFGTVITKKPLPIGGEKGYTKLGENDFKLNIDKHRSLKDLQINRDARQI